MNILRNKSGNALMVVFIIISVLTFLGISFNHMVTTDISITQNKSDYLKAEYLAKSGVGIALQKIIDNPELRENFISDIRGATIEATSRDFTTDPRDCIGGQYLTGFFKFATGDNIQQLTINLHTIAQLGFISSYHDPSSLGSNFKVETSTDNSNYVLWDNISSPKGQMIISKHAEISVKFIKISYGSQSGNKPAKIYKLFGMRSIIGMSDNSFSVFIKDFSDATHKTFIKYSITGTSVLCTARLMTKSTVWQTKSISSYKTDFIIENGVLIPLDSKFVDNNIPIHSSSEVDEADVISSLAD